MTYSKEELEQDLNFLISQGLVEVKIGDNGETLYKASDKLADLSEDELLSLIVKGLEDN